MRKAFIAAAAMLCIAAAQAQSIGEVSTSFKWIGPNHKIVVDAFDDPKVKGATCYLSRSKAGGISGAVGLADEKNEASIACRQTGPLQIIGALPENEVAFGEDRSVLFKKLKVVRMFDKQRQVLVYLAYSDKLIDGSPKNSISVIPLR
jgi:CreA protein